MIAPEVANQTVLGRKAGGRVVHGTGTDGKPVVLPMTSDRTCMLSAR